jgi:heme-degrading monooxygenase HmoA
MHARVAYYQFKPGAAQEVARRAEEGMLPIFQRHAGFRGYSVILTGGDTAYSISVWENEQQAAEAVKAAGDWVKQNVADMLESVKNDVGEVAFAHLAPHQ